MSKLLALTLCALSSSGVLAHAGNAAAPTDASCDQDPKCYARNLALTLTSTDEALVLERVVDFTPGSVRVYSKSPREDPGDRRQVEAALRLGGHHGERLRGGEQPRPRAAARRQDSRLLPSLRHSGGGCRRDRARGAAECRSRRRSVDRAVLACRQVRSGRARVCFDFASTFEPLARFERATYGLRNRCSTTEL